MAFFNAMRLNSDQAGLHYCTKFIPPLHNFLLNFSWIKKRLIPCPYSHVADKSNKVQIIDEKKHLDTNKRFQLLKGE